MRPKPYMPARTDRVTTLDQFLHKIRFPDPDPGFRRQAGGMPCIR